MLKHLIMSKEKLNYALKPDAQPFDEIKIRIEPRWKDSELSGSEWRISAVTEFYRKGAAPNLTEKQKNLLITTNI